MSVEAQSTAPSVEPRRRERRRRRLTAGPRGTSRTSLRTELVVGAAVLLLPWFANSDYVTSTTTKYLSFALLAISLDMLWGYAGLVSFGHGAIFGVGAYALGITLQHTSGVGGTYLGLLAAVVVCVIAGLGIGWFVFSSRQIVGGFGFSIVTLAFGLMLGLVATAWEPVTGGSNGLYGYAAPAIGVPGLQLTADSPWGSYYVVAFIAIVVYGLVRLLLSSDVGLVLRAGSQNEVRADTLGHSIGVYRMVVFAASAGVAGVAGALYLPTGVVTPGQMSLEFSTLAIIWVAFGGRGTLVGPVLGAVGLSWIQNYLSGELLTLSNLATGVLLTLIVLLWPDGLVGALRRVAGLFGRGRR
jgi:ABC-type branched-subunit amino acid transport system permease subunit